MANAADGDYVLSEVVICSPTGVSPNQRSTIYHGELKIDADFTDGLANALITTHEQRMIPLLQAQLERLAAFDLTKTNVQRSEFFVVERDKVLEEYKWYMEKRNNQLAISRQRDTGRNQISIQPVNAGGW